MWKKTEICGHQIGRIDLVSSRLNAQAGIIKQQTTKLQETRLDRTHPHRRRRSQHISAYETKCAAA